MIERLTVRRRSEQVEEGGGSVIGVGGAVAEGGDAGAAPAREGAETAPGGARAWAAPAVPR
jgi:hypothetical protein